MIIRSDELKPFGFDGLQIIDYTASLKSSSSFAVISVPSLGKHRPAWSKRSDKYYFVLAGEIRLVIDGIQYDLPAGDFALVERGQHFSYENLTEAEAKILLFHTPSFDLEAEVFEEETR